MWSTHISGAPVVGVCAARAGLFAKAWYLAASGSIIIDGPAQPGPRAPTYDAGAGNILIINKNKRFCQRRKSMVGENDGREVLGGRGKGARNEYSHPLSDYILSMY